MFKTLFASFLIFFSSLSFADNHSEKVKELMETVGLLEMFTQQMELSKQHGEKNGTMMLDQLMSQLAPSLEYEERFRTAFNNFMQSIEALWTPQEIVDIWAGIYGPNFTAKELDQLIAFYKSELGQKDVLVSRKSMIQFSEYFQNTGQPLIKEATNKYIQELKLIAKECNCQKK